jgi:hypothetical protein
MLAFLFEVDFDSEVERSQPAPASSAASRQTLNNPQHLCHIGSFPS